VIDNGEGRRRRVNKPEDGQRAVHNAKAEGFGFIKVGAYLHIET